MSVHQDDQSIVVELERELLEIQQRSVRVRDMFEKGPVHAVAPAVRLMDELDELREHVGLAFAMKETGGYLDEAVQAAPRLSSRAEELRSQHREIFSMLCRLIDECEQDLERHRWRRLQSLGLSMFVEFCGELKANEAGEADLLQLAVNEDVGVGD